jgi:exopolyphosphatase / guanosine-5'-triphosphate,3'-diphosphate pyrophosphatase
VSPQPGRLAAIDVGSNTILLLIAEYRPSAGLQIVAEDQDQPRLGAGLSETGRLSAAAIERSLRTLTRMRELCRRHEVSRIAAVATEAVRAARNGQEFVERARELGIPLRVISPEAEAELAYRAAAHHFPGGERVLVADIGGGSVELVGASERRITLAQSLPLGAVRLTDRGLPLASLRQEIGRQLGRAVPPAERQGSKVIGSGGTFATLAAMSLARRGGGGEVQGARVSAGEIEELLAELERMSPDDRRRVPGLPPERADIIVAGLAVAAEVLKLVRAEAVTVNAYGIREGLLLEMAESTSALSG